MTASRPVSCTRDGAFRTHLPSPPPPARPTRRRPPPLPRTRTHRSWPPARGPWRCARRPSSRWGRENEGSAEARPRAAWGRRGRGVPFRAALGPHRGTAARGGGRDRGAARRRAGRGRRPATPPLTRPLLPPQATRTKVPLELEKGEMPMNTFSNKAPFKVRGGGRGRGRTSAWRWLGAIGARPTARAAHFSAGVRVGPAAGACGRRRARQPHPTPRAPTPAAPPTPRV